ncbi:hypothetical protein Sme01_53810 [Sphaerisporangium melleum]|uniref:Uncharacterized protein n=1 Tax=Sphaerisporangium melleum TaxID=321316 RepID=A0A917R5V9_9ACTN|nr:hypothetical protein GCM10007964_37670 [Sphaerisporangium melleum]GII72905.1 hypothetical protein Sme01_53810 [Sphaerisporangium melleum]
MVAGLTCADIAPLAEALATAGIRKAAATSIATPQETAHRPVMALPFPRARIAV